MSKHNDNWINKVREELCNFTPEYNASDWDALKGNLPKPKTTSFWKKSKLNPWKGILFISGIALIGFALLKVLEKPNELKNNFIPDHTSSPIIAPGKSSERNNHAPSVSTDKTISEEPKRNSNQPFQAKERILQKKQSVKILSTILKEQKHQKTQTIPTDYLSAIKNTSPKLVNRKLVVKEDEAAKQSSDNKSTTKQLSFDKKEDQTLEKEKTLLSLQTDQISEMAEPENRKNHAKKLESQRKAPKKNKEKKKASKSKTIKRKTRVNIQKTKKVQIRHPFYYGLNTSLNYYNTSPYNSNTRFSGGLSFEKFISQKSSIEIAPKLNGGKFQFSENKTTYDTTIVTQQVIVDSIPTIHEHLTITENISTIQHTTNLIYLDIPVFYNLYFTNREKTSLGVSLGLSNKYLLSYRQDSEKVQLSQKLYLAHGGIIQFNYRHELNKDLHIRISPFAEIPFKNSPEKILNKTFYGIRFDLLFKTD